MQIPPEAEETVIRQLDCLVCGASGVQFEDIYSQFEFNKHSMRLVERRCVGCDESNAVAQYNPENVTLHIALSRPGTSCIGHGCDEPPIATVIENSDDGVTVGRFCKKHSSDEIREIHHKIKRVSIEL